LAGSDSDLAGRRGSRVGLGRDHARCRWCSSAADAGIGAFRCGRPGLDGRGRGAALVRARAQADTRGSRC